jgi:hypothetical protein
MLSLKVEGCIYKYGRARDAIQWNTLLECGVPLMMASGRSVGCTPPSLPLLQQTATISTPTALQARANSLLLMYAFVFGSGVVSNAAFLQHKMQSPS